MSCEVHNAFPDEPCDRCYLELFASRNKMWIEMQSLKHELSIRKAGQTAAVRMLEALDKAEAQKK